METSRTFKPRYHADLSLAMEKVVPNISHIALVDESDGTFVVRFAHPLLEMPDGLEVQILPQEWSGYPSKHFFVAQPNAPHPAALVPPFDEFAAQSFGVKIYESLATLSQRLGAALGSTHDTQDKSMQDVTSDEGGETDESDEFDDFVLDNDEVNSVFGLGGGAGNGKNRDDTFGKTLLPAALSRIRCDLRAARATGFKVGIPGNSRQHEDFSIVSLAVCVDKLCLSKETRQAWGLGREDFVVLLIQYPDGYTTYEETVDRAAGLSKIQFRLRKCGRYKPSLAQARKALSLTASEKEPDGSSHLGLLSVGESIDTFMENDFVPMLKLREKEGVSWDDAKKLLADMSINMTGTAQEDQQLRNPFLMRQHSRLAEDQAKLPAFIATDHLPCSGEISLPLVAARFAMRYLVRCVDYCLVCHEAVDDSFEALKPYVCGKPLCLFQYMSMGLGPSIDQEILTQPNVVDLLISFCYSGLTGPGLREYPTGLNLQVPKISKELPQLTPCNNRSTAGVSASSPAPVRVGGVWLIDPINIIFNGDSSTAELVTPSETDTLREGLWVVVVVPDENKPVGSPVTAHHGRIEIIDRGTITLRLVSTHELPGADHYGTPVMVNATTDPESSEPRKPKTPGYMLPYNQNMDELEALRKPFPMTLLLETIPSVASMRSHLSSHPDQQIEKWEKLTPSASKLLRWVIASNRSYIVQVDECPTADGKPEPGLARRREKISGVDGWLQFRFVQGSPERELRFQHALQRVQRQPKSLLAWHGSSLGNWHSITRAGLDFERVVNGRVYGDGVYFSRNFDVSQGYIGRAVSLIWPNSVLKVEAALSLNELVNLPEQYVHSNDFCYVITDLHWIQCRYLFVRSRSLSGSSAAASSAAASSAAASSTAASSAAASSAAASSAAASSTAASSAAASSAAASSTAASSTVASSSAGPTEVEFVQDAKHAATGVGGRRLFVPRTAIPSAQDNGRKQPQSDDRRTATGHSGDTGDEDSADRDFFLADEKEDDDAARELTPTGATFSAEAKQPRLDDTGNASMDFILYTTKTDFRPGSLDLDTLPKLAPPSYATPQAQKTIGREIGKLQAVQSSSPIHELGWFIDFGQITNMFHWIVELHSFEPSLPLAVDMKKAGVTSIVLELRFGREFPLSPPFVRVIRPRFLPFANGGGGHVTGGGAMCMELLTNSGWSPASSLEGVLVQVRLALSNTEPQPARLDVAHRYRHDYAIGEALDAFKRAATMHAWDIPPDLTETVTTMVDTRNSSA